MLRGLIVRRVLVVADVVFVGLIALSGVFFVLGGADVVGPSDGVGALPAGPEDYEDMFAKVGPRPAYNKIVASRIFGMAASRTSDYVDPAPVEEEQEEAETELPLRLWGTVVAGPQDPLSTAVIEVKEGAPTLGTYYLNQEVLKDVVLVEVRRKEVILDNRRTNRIEHLRMLEGEARLAAAASPPSRRPAALARRRSSASEMVTMDRKEFSQGLIDNYADLTNNVDVRVHKDSNGKVDGLTASNISTIPLARKLGIQDNDVLTSVNNEQIDSVEKVYEIVNKYRNASTFRIGILRNGKRKNITYRLR